MPFFGLNFNSYLGCQNLTRYNFCQLDFFEDRFLISILPIFFHRQYKEYESQSEEETNYRSFDGSPTYKGLLMVWGLHVIK